MIALIEEGRSLLEAGRTGDQDLIPVLQRYIASAKNDSGRREALMALARLGDSDAQQFIVCTFYGNDKNAMQHAAEEELPYIGGWFSINVYRYLLSPEADTRFLRAKEPESSDQGFISPSAMAIMGLPKVVPDPPLRPGADFLIRGDVDHDRQVWLKWISQNQHLLQQLTPLGEKVDFSGNACKHLRQPWKMHKGGCDRCGTEPDEDASRESNGIAVNPEREGIAKAIVHLRASGGETGTRTTAGPNATDVTVKTDEKGRFSLETESGRYRVCVEAQGYHTDCRDVSTPAKAELRFTLGPAAYGVSPELLDKRIKMIAGTGAIDCGHVTTGGSPKAATSCVLTSYRKRKAFYVAYDRSGIDSKLIAALAWDGKGKVYTVHFDNAGEGGEDQLNAATALDSDHHSQVIACHQPVKFNVKEGRAACLSSDPLQ